MLSAVLVVAATALSVVAGAIAALVLAQTAHRAGAGALRNVLFVLGIVLLVAWLLVFRDG